MRWQACDKRWRGLNSYQRYDPEQREEVVYVLGKGSKKV